MIFCEACRNEGIFLEGNSIKFCSCLAGQERKRAWDGYTEKVKIEAIRQRKKKYHPMKDYKAEAAGDREPGEDDAF